MLSVRRDNALSFLDELQRKPVIELDFDNIVIDRAGAAVLGVGLLRNLSDRPLRVRGARRNVAMLEGSGLAFALATRADAHAQSLEWLTPELRERISLQAWRTTWVPKAPSKASTSDLQLDLFDPQQLDEGLELPGMRGPSYASFINAHRSGVTGDRATVASNIEPWLLHVVPRFVRRALPRNEAIGALVRRASDALHELVINVREHAASDLLFVHSLVQVAVVHGEYGHDLLVSVVDDGAGIPSTFRTKRASAPTDDAELLRGLLGGSFGYWGRVRGIGLRDVTELATKSERGQLYVASGRGAVLATHNAEPGSKPNIAVIERAKTALQGTVVLARFPLGSSDASRGESSHGA